MKSLTAYNDQNAREIEAMVGKAMCAYANWMNNKNCAAICNDEKLAKLHADAAIASQSEYEATVRCVAMFVRDSVYEIQTLVIERAKAELGV